MRIENEFLPYNLTKKLIELGYKRNTEYLGGFCKYADEDRIFFMTAAEEATSSIRRDTNFEEIGAILWQQAFDYLVDKIPEGYNYNQLSKEFYILHFIDMNTMKYTLLEATITRENLVTRLIKICTNEKVS